MNEKFIFTKTGNVLYVKVQGRFSAEDGQNFIQMYQSIVSSMSDKQEVNMNCMEIQLTTAELVELLTGFFEMYKQDFPKVCIQVKDDIFLKMQLSRLARRVDLNLTFSIAK